MRNILVLPCEQVLPEMHPEEKFSAIINVSDSPCSTFDHSCPSFWFPIQELGRWGHAPFYAAAKVVDHYDVEGSLPVAIHCHAGVNRSMCVTLAIQLADGHWPKEINIKPWNGPAEGCMGLFERNIQKGCIPDNIVEFLAERKQFPTYSILGLLAELGGEGIKHHIYADFKRLKSAPDNEL